MGKMELIPAVDLKQGLVVHAQGGRRDRYRPVCTDHFPDASPLKLIERLVRRFDPATVYLADLDAIQRQGGNHAVIARIHRSFPALALWLDAGIGDHKKLTADRAASGIQPVVGTETLRDDINHFKRDEYILSLDFNGAGLIGRDILDRSDEWPQTVIALSLDAVGSGRGPNLETLRRLRARHRGRLIAGGGVRNKSDLSALAAIGIDGALVATAIYHGRIGAAVD